MRTSGMAIAGLLVLLFTSVFCQSNVPQKAHKSVESPDELLVYTVDLSEHHLKFFYKNKEGENYANHGNLKSQLEKNSNRLIFAVNGGMYNRDHTPQGLYVEDGKLIAPLDTTREGYGNFYLQPNGIFYLTKNKKAAVVATDHFTVSEEITYATQSGPMLVIDGKIHPKFNEGSPNLHIRNGVGILPDGKVLFVISKEKINFFDLATYFKSQGCQNALYLDGFVSRMYLPERYWEQTDGNFGVIIGVVEDF